MGILNYSRIISNLIAVCVGEGLGLWGRVFVECGGGVGSGGMIIGDAMIPFSSSRFEIPVFEIPVFEINI
jgi:hypothetical protein